MKQFVNWVNRMIHALTGDCMITDEDASDYLRGKETVCRVCGRKYP